MKNASDTEALREAGKATGVLQAFSVALMIGLAIIFAVISHRYAQLQDGIRENALWSIYQLDREARRLHETTHDLITRGAYDDTKGLAAAALRYDILYSRMTILNEAHFDRGFGGDQETVGLRRSVSEEILALEPFFNGITAKGATSDPDLQAADAQLETLVRSTEALLLHTNDSVSIGRAEARAELLSLQITSALLVLLLVICVGCLIHLLRRQLRSVRAAGLRLKTMAADLEEAYCALDSANRAKSQFLATMSHEVRTPLNAILGTAELLELSNIAPSTRQSVGTIRRSGESLLEIINEILDYAKIESGMLNIETRPTDLRTVAETALGIVADRATENRNELKLEVGEDVSHPVILCDPTRLRQVLLNLLSNSAKFTTDGHIILRLKQFAKEGQSWVRFEVSDTGIGIDGEGMEKLFQPFSQVDASISRRFGGTGLGLTICRQLVERLGGQIGVSSRRGHGSTFWFEIPATPAMLQPNTSAAPSSVEGLPRLKVLLVEDNKVNQDVAKSFLFHLGQDATVASDGLEAVERVRQERFDLVLMDMQMPVVDGLEATRRIRGLPGRHRDPAIVAMTANASEEDRRRCAEAGMVDFCAKPISMAALRRVLVTAYSSKPSEQPPAASYMDRRSELTEALGADGYEELLSDFLTDAERLIESIRTSAELGDPSKTATLLHSLRGAAGNLGFESVVALCRDLEASGSVGQQIDTLEATFEEERRRVAA